MSMIGPLKLREKTDLNDLLIDALQSLRNFTKIDNKQAIKLNIIIWEHIYLSPSTIAHVFV
jgi:hypothetical protein